MKTSAVVLLVAVVVLAACREPVGGPSLPPSITARTEWALRSTIAFSSTRDDPTNPNPARVPEIYLMEPDGTNPRRLTDNHDAEYFAALSPDGKKIVFTSNRLRAPSEPQNTSDLFVMDADGSEQTFLLRGASASWSPDGKNVAFHASASGTGLPIKADAGAATWDSDIFVANVDDVLEQGAGRRNLTDSPDAIDDDADWSPDGTKIVFTSHAVTDNQQNSVTGEIYIMNADGSGAPVRLTTNAEEERAPSWSKDGSRIVYMCRHGGSDFEICIMNADGTGQVQLTDNANAVADATPTFSPDGTQIVFHRTAPGLLQLFVMQADGTGQTALTTPPGANGYANWGEVRVRVPGEKP